MRVGSTQCAAMLGRRTKIVATLGPATDSDDVLDALVAAGLSCARLNCSHGSADDLRRRHAAVRAAAERAQRPIGVLFDLQGPKLRLSSAVEPVVVAVGDEVIFGPGGVPVDFDDLPALVTERSELVIGDGVPRFAVVGVAGPDVVARAVSPGPLSARKGINVTYARPELPAITPKDEADLALALECGADFVALSFVRSAADMALLRSMVGANRTRLVAKIEKIEAYEALDSILAESDGVMVARGDYGVEAGVARVPLMQKDTIRRATQAGKFVITATQMLESMIQAPEPTRAEATDVANAVIDGTSAVMLSAETSVGAYPVEAVRAMSDIALAAEESPVIHGRAVAVATGVTSDAVIRAAVDLAEELDAAALIVPTSTGLGARVCSKYRRPRAIIALAHAEGVAEALTLEWGVFPTTMPVMDTVDDMIDAALVIGRDFGGLAPGDRVVLTAGRQTGTPGATNLVMVRTIPE
jgi:pyruvate kinase